MGFQSDDWWGSPSVVSNLFNQGIIASAVIAFKLAPDDSELNIGGLNSALYSGTPYYTPITQPGSWQVTFSTFTVGSTALPGDKAYMISVRLELHYYSSC
jgi:cathepsin D